MTLFEAFENGDTAELARLLEATDSDVNAADEHGWTLLHWAAGRGDLALVTRLVERGADVWRRGRDHRTAYLVALAAGHRETVAYLKSAEERSGGDADRTSSRQEENRPYCRAVTAESLKAFPGWLTIAEEPRARLAEAPIAFLHHDFTITRSVLHGDNLLPDVTPTAEWRSFCVEQLGAAPLTDLGLLSAE